MRKARGKTDRHARYRAESWANQIRIDTEIAERTKRPGVAVGWPGPGWWDISSSRQQDEGARAAHDDRTDSAVMQESMQAALDMVRSNAEKLAIPEEFFKDHDIHIHCRRRHPPRWSFGGVTMATALVLCSGTPVRP